MLSSESAIGLLQITASVCIFGSMFVPIKRYNAGDGFFCQWLICIGVLLVGFGVHVSQGFPPFYPVASIGGAIWATGNSMAIIVINELGLGLSVLLFSIINSLISFLTGYFGLFWTTPRPPSHLWLSIVGIVLTLIGGGMISQVKNKQTNELPESRSSSPSTDTISSKADSEEAVIASSIKTPTSAAKIMTIEILSSSSEPDESDGNKAKFNLRRVMIIALALLLGLFTGLCLTPVIAIQDNADVFGDVSTYTLRYTFSHFFGTFIASSVIFVGYAIVKRNRPYVNPEIVLPSLLSGVFWAAAMIFYFLSTEKLSQAITGPLSAMVPGCVASAWSIFYFREIEPGMNLYLLYAAILVTLSGSVLIGLSK